MQVINSSTIIKPIPIENRNGKKIGIAEGNLSAAIAMRASVNRLEAKQQLERQYPSSSAVRLRSRIAWFGLGPIRDSTMRVNRTGVGNGTAEQNIGARVRSISTVICAPTDLFIQVHGERLL